MYIFSKCPRRFRNRTSVSASQFTVRIRMISRHRYRPEYQKCVFIDFWWFRKSHILSGKCHIFPRKCHIKCGILRENVTFFGTFSEPPEISKNTFLRLGAVPKSRHHMYPHHGPQAVYRDAISESARALAIFVVNYLISREPSEYSNVYSWFLTLEYLPI